MKKNNTAEFELETSGISRTSPHAMDMEMKVLGSILIEPECISDILVILNDKHFYKPAHGLIFKAMIDMYEKSLPIDPALLKSELAKTDFSKIVTYATIDSILSELLSSVSSTANVLLYAQIVVEQWIKRKMIQTSSKVIEDCLDPSRDTLEALQDAEMNILDISESLSKKKTQNVKQELDEMLSHLETGDDAGLRTGFEDIDSLTGGLQNSELIIIAGRPSHGKTALALNIARNVGLEHKNVAIFSLEMSFRELMIRHISMEARVDGRRLKLGKANLDEWKRISDNKEKMRTNIFIDDSSDISVLEIRAKARKINRDNKLDLIIVDYLQLIKGSLNAERRDLEVANISRNLKALAKELNIPVIALSQLNRNIETRGKEKRPQLSDLRESGAIEQDADVVIFVHRPIVGMKYAEGDTDMEDMKRRADIIIGKQRNGPTGDVRLVYISEYTKFENMSREPVFRESRHYTEEPF